MISNSSEEITNYFLKHRVVHCSFDYWNTIVVPNPRFKEFRSNVISTYLDVDRCRLESAIQSVGATYNLEQEAGISSSSPEMLLERVFESIGVSLTLPECVKLQSRIEEGFIENPPTPNPLARDVVEFCLENDVTISITSNTAFMPGTAVRRVLEREFGEGSFQFFLFSDELKIAKPQLEIFELCLEKIRSLHKFGFSKSQIAHLGDSENNDYLPAKSMGLRAVKIF